MKKSVRFILPIIPIFSLLLFGCNPSNGIVDERTMITFGDLNIDTDSFKDYSSSYKYDIDNYDELKNKIAKENIVLVVGTSTCECWTKLSNIVATYINKTHTIIYRVAPSIFNGQENKLGIKVINGTSSLAIFENGQIKFSLNTAEDIELRDAEKFENFMTKYVSSPKMYYMNEQDFEDVVLNPINKSVVYFIKNSCEDCKNSTPSILRPYFETHRAANSIFVLDCDYFASTLTGQDYKDKKDDLYLAELSNDKYGYKDGVFPTLMYFEEASPSSGAVIYNDTIEMVNNELIVTDSYYTNERRNDLEYLDGINGTSVIKGMKLDENDTANDSVYYYWDYEFANQIYKPIVNAFLDWSLPKTKIV